MIEIPVEVNIGRVIKAISKIGYTPSSAIMDIVDNAVAAAAKNIEINIYKDEDKRVREKHSLKKVSIIDNGNGMDREHILKALSLGSDVKYETGSLSKYGMGLKSAGFSLGNIIRVISKKNNVFSNIYELDENLIIHHGKYFVNETEMKKEEKEEYMKLISNPSGTIIEVINCLERTKDSLQKIKDELIEKLGVTYYPFLNGKNIEISIIEHLSGGKECHKIEPFDILFKKYAKNEFDPDKYDYKSPYKIFDEKVSFSSNSDKVSVEVYVFPQDQMQRHIDFTEEERDLIKNYKIGTKNSGFFIYRNNRLIRWGDDLLGEIGRDLKGFRGRILLNETHDDLFNIDVSKQRLNISEDTLTKISELMRLPKKTAKTVFELCNKKMRQGDKLKEGQTFNEKNLYLASEDPEIVKPTQDIKERKKKIIGESNKILKEELSEKKENSIDNSSSEDSKDVFKKIRYSNEITGNYLWTAHDTVDDDVFVRINKNHYFYSTILQQLNKDDNVKQIVEAMLWCLGVAEIMTLENLTEIEIEKIEKVFDKYKKLFSYNMDNWCSNNNSLLGE